MPTAVPAASVAPSRTVLWRITDRRTFTELREHGRRARQGAVAVTYLAPVSAAPDGPPRAAFAVGKAAGGAVVRNRIKRRLRAGLRALQLEGAVPMGAYLLTARAEAATSPWPELLGDLRAAVREATR